MFRPFRHFFRPILIPVASSCHHCHVRFHIGSAPYLPCFITYLISEVAKIGSVQLQVLSPFVTLPSSFETDGVHLNGEAGLSFIQYLVTGLDQLVPASSTSTEAGSVSTHLAPAHPFASSSGATGGSSTVPEPGSISAHLTPANLFATSSGNGTSDPNVLQSAVANLASLTGSMRAEITARRLQDNLVFARLKEDQDYAFNKNREDRFTLSGLRINPTRPPPQEALARKEYFKEVISALVLKACPDLDPQPEVKDVFVNMRNGRGAPFFEVRLGSAASSAAFRLAAARLVKDEDPVFVNLFVANSVTLTTRVRIEIMRAIAGVLTTDSEEAYVQSFTSRPMLHYQAREGVIYKAPGTNRSYSFVEAVGRWGDKLTPLSLVPAYRRARPAFVGCLEQYFVVLKEGEAYYETSSGFDQLFGMGSNSVAIGRGRAGRRSFANLRLQTRGRPPFGLMRPRYRSETTCLQRCPNYTFKEKRKCQC